MAYPHANLRTSPSLAAITAPSPQSPQSHVVVASHHPLCTESCTVAASADRRVECRSDRMPHLRARQHNDLKGAAHAGRRGGAEERIGVVWLARRARVRVWAVRTCCPHDQAIICSITLLMRMSKLSARAAVRRHGGLHVRSTTRGLARTRRGSPSPLHVSSEVHRRQEVLDAAHDSFRRSGSATLPALANRGTHSISEVRKDAHQTNLHHLASPEAEFD